MVAVVTLGGITSPVVPTRPGRHVARRPVRASRATFRRRRIVVAVLVVAGIAGTARAAVALGGPTLAPERPPAVSTPVTHVVEPGDSLWTIAQELTPGRDPRPVVDSLVALRGPGPLMPGERITWGG